VEPGSKRPTAWPSGIDIEMRPLNESLLPAAQRVYEEVPGYFAALTGSTLPKPDEARIDFEGLPPGHSLDRKYYFGIWRREEKDLVGILDYLDGYPRPSIGWIGLLLISERIQRRGLGRHAWEILAHWATRELWNREFQLGVLDTNPGALLFWNKMGFRRTGQSKPGPLGRTIIVFSRPALEDSSA